MKEQNESTETVPEVGSDDLLKVVLVGDELYVAALSEEEAIEFAAREYYGTSTEELDGRAADDHTYYPDVERTGPNDKSWTMLEQATEQAKGADIPFIVGHSLHYL